MFHDHPAQLDESPWPHRFAVVLACATFPLIWVGGLVTTYKAGMAVEDWPTTRGYNMFLYPWETWVYGPFNLFIEHGHRLLGALVGMLTIAFVVAVFLSDRRPWMKVVSIVALLGVIGQGSLGGMRVLMDDRQLAMLHGCIGPVFFAFTVALAVFTSRLWRQAVPQVSATAARLQRLAIMTAVLAYVQLVIGATLRHLPLDVSAKFFEIAVLFHLIVAVAVTGHVFALAVRIVRQHRDEVSLIRPAFGLCSLIVAQLLLGSATWIVKYGWPAWFADLRFAAGYTIQANSRLQGLTVTAHVATGSLILVTAVLIAVRSLRLFSPFGVELAAKKPGQSGGQRGDLVHRSLPFATEPLA